MDSKKIEHINQLARKAKSSGLTEDEKKEQQALRNEYRESIVKNFTEQLENCYIVDEKGNRQSVKSRRKNNS